MGKGKELWMMARRKVNLLTITNYLNKNNQGYVIIFAHDELVVLILILFNYFLTCCKICGKIALVDFFFKCK